MGIDSIMVSTSDYIGEGPVSILDIVKDFSLHFLLPLHTDTGVPYSCNNQE
jgi:hypothetical protein